MKKLILILVLFLAVFLPCCTCYTIPLYPEHQESDGGGNIEKSSIDIFSENSEPHETNGNLPEHVERESQKDNSPDSSCRNGLKRMCRPSGACSDGVQSCIDGEWDQCKGFLSPKTETCNNLDDDCDGLIDNPKCYTGPPETKNIGSCAEGVYICNKATNSKIDICTNEKTPSQEVCDLQDNNCNGQVDEGGVCNSTPNAEEMVKIPQGSFIMGSDLKVDENSKSDEMPYMKVILDSYLIDKYEVTNQAYKKCIEEKKCALPQINPYDKTDKNFPKDYFTNQIYRDFPVVGVTWWDARAYCLSKNKDLPTEAQWERAAKGMISELKTPWPKYPWGDTIPISCDFANMRIETFITGPDNKLYRSFFFCAHFPSKIGAYSKDKTLEGARDMAGNVLEWTKDCHSKWYGLSKELTNPAQLDCDKNSEPDPERYSSIRGGSFYSTTHDSRTTSRRGRAANKPAIWLGFRCAKKE